LRKNFGAAEVFLFYKKMGSPKKMESFEKNWYVLHTYSGYENKVKANLESRAQSMGMGDYIFQKKKTAKPKKSFIKPFLVMC